LPENAGFMIEFNKFADIERLRNNDL